MSIPPGQCGIIKIMSKRKDRERAGETGTVFRDGHLVKIGEEVSVTPILRLRCQKCHHSIPEYMVDEHIETCQGGKTECGKCHRYIPAKGFMGHFRNCEGKP